MITVFDHSIPGVLRMVFAVPNVILMNIMACQVFRNKMFESYGEGQFSTNLDLRTEVIPLPSIYEGESGRRTKQEDGALDITDNAESPKG